MGARQKSGKISESKLVISFSDLIVSIFNEVLCKEEIEPELRLKMFLTLSKQMGNLRNTLNSQSEFAQSLALNIVTDLILPAVKWQAGRKNEAVRIAGNDFQWFKHIPNFAIIRVGI